MFIKLGGEPPHMSFASRTPPNPPKPPATNYTSDPPSRSYSGPGPTNPHDAPIRHATSLGGGPPNTIPAAVGGGGAAGVSPLGGGLSGASTAADPTNVHPTKANILPPRRATVAATVTPPAPVDDSMVPLEAPRQGVWFDRAPFDAATGRGIDGGDGGGAPGGGSNEGVGSNADRSRQAGAIGEATEANTGAYRL